MGRWRNQDAWDPEIRQAHQAFRAVPIPVIKAIIAKESAFRKDAIRGEPHLADSSRGLGQLLLSTARAEGYGGTPENLFTPAINIYYTTKHLDRLMAQLGNWDDVFSAYNGGIRPDWGFGRKATRLVRGICLERDSKGDCTRRVNVPPGTYANQSYVDKVKEFVKYFGHDHASTEGGERAGFTLRAMPPAVAGAGGISLLILAALAYFTVKGN